MCEQDGVDHLLKAIRHYSELFEQSVLFTFVGGGPDQQRMKAMSTEMGLSEWVEFTGRVPDELLWRYLATADLCVDPDPLTEWSNLSTMNKMIEYMAFGRPIVAFDLAEHRRSAGDAAVYVEPNDDLKLCLAIRDLLLDEDRRQALGRYGRDRFRTDLAWERSEQELVAMYTELLGAKQAGRVVAATEA
jgi:glycosyltransferase involved in cell wall biosynthesis